MLFVSILFAISIHQEVESKWDEDFKHNNAAVELLQKLEWEWEIEQYMIGEEHRHMNFSQYKFVVSDWVFKEIWSFDRESKRKCVAFSPNLNALKIVDANKTICFATIKEGKLVLVQRQPQFLMGRWRIEDAKANGCYVFKRK